MVALAVAAALGLYTHLYFVLLFGALGLSLLALPAARVPWRGLLATGALVVVLMLPMLLQPFGQQLDWVLPLSLRDAARIPLYFGGHSDWVTPLFLLGWCGAIALAVQRWRISGRSEAVWRWVLPLCAFLAPAAADRRLAAGAAGPRAALPVGLPARRPRGDGDGAGPPARARPAPRRAGGAAGPVPAGPRPMVPPSAGVEDWRGLLAWVAPEGRPDDAVVFLPYFHIYSYRFYAARSATRRRPAGRPRVQLRAVLRRRLGSDSGPAPGIHG